MSEGNADAGIDVDADSADDAPAAADSDGPSTEEVAALADEDWRAALGATGELRPVIVKAIIETHGGRGRRAIEAVSEQRVKQYRDFTVVVGHRAEHVVEGSDCDCPDATYNLDAERPNERCWHAIAVDVAERVGRVDHHDMWYSDVHDFL